MNRINNESDFENHLRIDILPTALPNKNYKLFDSKKAVDILISKDGVNPKLFFIEVKYHKANHGRLGFGHAKGKGFQPEILKRKVDYFENNLRWVLGSEDSEQYWFVDNTILRNYLNNGSVGEKYNGIRKELFTNFPSLSKAKLIIEISNWLRT